MLGLGLRGPSVDEEIQPCQNSLLARECPALFSANSEGACPACNGAGVIYTDSQNVGTGWTFATLSGGELQRLEPATHLDESAAGLHPADVELLLALLDRLVKSGKTVTVIEHRQAAIAYSDWIIDLGRGAGHGAARSSFRVCPRASWPTDRRKPANTWPNTWGGRPPLCAKDDGRPTTF